MATLRLEQNAPAKHLGSAGLLAQQCAPMGLGCSCAGLLGGTAGEQSARAKQCSIVFPGIPMGAACVSCKHGGNEVQEDINKEGQQTEANDQCSSASEGFRDEVEDADLDLGEKLTTEQCSRSYHHHQSFLLLNQGDEDLNQQFSRAISGGSDLALELSAVGSTSLGLDRIARVKRLIHAPGIETEDATKITGMLLVSIENLVDKNYDLLAAELLLVELQGMLGEEEWRKIMASPLFERFSRKVAYFHLIGQACNQDESSWFVLYSDEKQEHFIHGRIDDNDKSVVHYRVSCVIPARLTQVMAVANEVQLMPTWNPLVSKTPEVIGRRTGHYLVLNYQISVMGGLYKIDFLNEIRRFSDVEKGFLAEYIVSADSSHPCYRKPLSGHKRPQTELRNIWIACGPNHSQLFQFGKLKLPFNVTKFFAKRIGAIAGQFIISGLVKNSVKASQPENPWEQAMADDALGLYARMEECVKGWGSSRRLPKGNRLPSVPNDALLDLFIRPLSSQLKPSQLELSVSH